MSEWTVEKSPCSRPLDKKVTMSGRVKEGKTEDGEDGIYGQFKGSRCFTLFPLYKKERRNLCVWRRGGRRERKSKKRGKITQGKYF